MKQQVKSFATQTMYLAAAMIATVGIFIAAILLTGAETYAQCEVQGGSELSITEGANCGQGNQQPADLFGQEGIFTTVTNVLLFLIGAISVIMLIIGGIRYTISNGDQGAITSAKNTILYAIIGLVVAILAYAAVNFVVTQFAGPQ